MRVFTLVVSLVAFTFVSCSSEAISTIVAPSVDTLNAEQIKALAADPAEIVFVDVRTTGEIAQTGTIEGAILIPINEFEARFEEVPRGKKVVVACARGGRAARGASILKKNGYSEVYSAGLREYVAKGYPLVQPVGP